MSTPPQEQQAIRQEVQQRLDSIGKNVLQELGHPDDLHSVQVRSLWGDHFRANVFAGADAMSTRIVHSFFVVADGAGNVVTSVPAIKRKY